MKIVLFLLELLYDGTVLTPVKITSKHVFFKGIIVANLMIKDNFIFRVVYVILLFLPVLGYYNLNV